MAILGWILFGLVVGVIAKLLMPGRDPGGIIVTMLLGIAGSVTTGFIMRNAFRTDPDRSPTRQQLACSDKRLLVFRYVLAFILSPVNRQ